MVVGHIWPSILDVTVLRSFMKDDGGLKRRLGSGREGGGSGGGEVVGDGGAVGGGFPPTDPDGEPDYHHATRT